MSKFSFIEQAQKAKEVLESEVRPQVAHYEEVKKLENDAKNVTVLSPEQKAHRDCIHLL